MGTHKHRRHHQKQTNKTGPNKTVEAVDVNIPRSVHMEVENYNPNTEVPQKNQALKMISNPENTEVKEEDNENVQIPVEVVRALNGGEGPVSSVLFYGVKKYENAKQKVMAMENKRVKSTVGSALDLFEGTVSKATQYSPLKVERVVGALDSSVDSAIQYGKETTQSVGTKVAAVSERPIRLKNETLKTIHTQLEKLKEEKETKIEAEQDIGFRKIFGDVQEITSSRAQKLLDASETMVDKYLEKGSEEENDIQVETKQKDITSRVFHLSKVVSKRMQKKAFSGLESLKRRTDDVVHVDLMKYSKMLDSAKDFAISSYEHRVAQPFQKVKTEAGVKANDAKDLAEKYGKLGYDKIVHVHVPYTEHDILYYLLAMKEKLDSRVVKPFEEVIEVFKKDLEVEKMKQNPDKPLTIEAGFRALIAAARYRTGIIFGNAKTYVFQQ